MDTDFRCGPSLTRTRDWHGLHNPYGLARGLLVGAGMGHHALTLRQPLPVRWVSGVPRVLHTGSHTGSKLIIIRYCSYFIYCTTVWPKCNMPAWHMMSCLDPHGPTSSSVAVMRATACMPGGVKRGREGDAPIPPHKGALRERAH